MTLVNNKPHVIPHRKTHISAVLIFELGQLPLQHPVFRNYFFRCRLLGFQDQVLVEVPSEAEKRCKADQRREPMKYFWWLPQKENCNWWVEKMEEWKKVLMPIEEPAYQQGDYLLYTYSNDLDWRTCSPNVSKIALKIEKYSSLAHSHDF